MSSRFAPIVLIFTLSCLVPGCSAGQEKTVVDCHEDIDPYYRHFDVSSMIHVNTADEPALARASIVEYLWAGSGYMGRIPGRSRTTARWRPSWKMRAEASFVFSSSRS